MANPRPKPNPNGRPKGTPNKVPSKQRIFDALHEKGFNWFDEFIELYRTSKREEIKEKMLKNLSEFLFPKIRPVDLDGNPDRSGEHVGELVKVFSELLSESRRNK